jgi:excisionase family DNA binding protein
MADKRKLLYTTKEAADLLGAHPETIRRAVRNGELYAAQVGQGFKISGYELEKFFRKRGGGMLFGENSTDTE